MVIVDVMRENVQTMGKQSEQGKTEITMSGAVSDNMDDVQHLVKYGNLNTLRHVMRTMLVK